MGCAVGTPRKQPSPERQLAVLRRRLWDKPANSVVKLGDWRIRITDGPNAYMQYKDVVARGIYRFAPGRPDPLIIDGGSNMGVSVLSFKRDHPQARVVAFEPDPAIAAMLDENLRRNGIEDVRIVTAGLSDRDGIVSFAADGSAGGRVMGATDASPCATDVSSVREPDRDSHAKHCRDDSGALSPNQIRVERLSTYLTEPVDFLKLNIEGEELAVLRECAAAGRLKNVRRLVLEYHGWAGGQQRLGDLLNLLDHEGFRYFVHDFDRETCPMTKPPFRHRPKADWFCLVFAENIGSCPTGRCAEAHPTSPTPRRPNLGDLRTTAPISRVFGLDRGTAIDRYYIENFLRDHAADIRGRVLELGEPTYIRQFGGDRVTHPDVLHATPGNRKATLVGDLATGAGIPENAFDCIILTQVLPFLYDVRGAVATVHRALRPGGVCLATLPCISQISRYDMDRWGDFWRFTSLAAQRLFAEAFADGEVQVRSHGNVLAATAFVQGMAQEELTPAELDHHDPDYELIITIRAVRKGTP